MIGPNRLTAPGEAAARERVEELFTAADRLTPDDLRLTVIAEPDAALRASLLSDVERLANARGRGPLLERARERLRDALLMRAVSRFRAETGAVGATTGGRTEDLARVLMVLGDAVAVAVVQDAMDPADAAMLADPGRRILGLAPIPGSAAPAAAVPRWEPSAADWEAAEPGDAEAVAPESPPATRALRTLFFGAGAIVGVPAAIGWGVAGGSPWIGLLAALAIVAVCWTFATWRRPA